MPSYPLLGLGDTRNRGGNVRESHTTHDEIILGIDEAGRGPLAGPLVVAGVVLKEPLKGLNDSKKLSAQKRETLYELIITHSHYHIAVIDHTLIDEYGLSYALRQGIAEVLKALPGYKTIMDGNSRFGFANLIPIVKADASIPEVSAASILAKVTRDRWMDQQAVHYPHYNFLAHKGYGTQQHREEIARYGLSPIHRKSFRLKTPVASLFDDVFSVSNPVAP